MNHLNPQLPPRVGYNGEGKNINKVLRHIKLLSLRLYSPPLQESPKDYKHIVSRIQQTLSICEEQF
jgi:hypothetical protein